MTNEMVRAESNHHLNELTRKVNKNSQCSISWWKTDINFDTKKVFYYVLYNWFDINNKKLWSRC